jgi:hypothetical protein
MSDDKKHGASDSGAPHSAAGGYGPLGSKIEATIIAKMKYDMKKHLTANKYLSAALALAALAIAATPLAFAQSDSSTNNSGKSTHGWRLESGWNLVWRDLQ